MSTFTRGRSARQRKRNRNSTSSRGHGRTFDDGPLATFFAQYSLFEYNPASSATSELYRLYKFYGWGKEHNSEKQQAKEGFQDALTMQFNNSYGTDENDITNWQGLCARLGMDPVPESLNACRDAVKSTHVNLVDLVDIFGTQEKAQTFPTVVALSKYTKFYGKFFPKDNAYAGNLLKFLLRQILNPYRLSQNEGGRARGRGRGGRRGRGA